MKCPFQVGEFPFPVKYGYALVGLVEAGPPELVGHRVFALHPHQLRFTIPLHAAILIPDATPSRRATLAANMETALNALWDSGAGPGDRVAIVGGGPLGCLIAGLLGATPGVEAVLVDIEPARAKVAKALGVRFVAPEQALSTAGDCDIVFHVSASEAGLATALSLAGDEGAVVEASWYGDATPRVALGGVFHGRRLRLISSQVGQVAPSRRPRWPHARRLAKAVELLADPRYEALITDEIAFQDAPALLPGLLAEGAPGLAAIIRYPDAAGDGANARGA